MRKLRTHFIVIFSVIFFMACAPKEPYKLDIQVDKSLVRGLELTLELSRDSIELNAGEFLVYELYFKNKMTDTLFLPENRFVMLYRQHQRYVKVGAGSVRVMRMDKPMFSLDTVYFNENYSSGRVLAPSGHFSIKDSVRVNEDLFFEGANQLFAELRDDFFPKKPYCETSTERLVCY